MKTGRSQMEWKVYILWSEKKSRTYVGCSANINARLDAHNKGKVMSTKNYRPWTLLYEEEVFDYKAARKREKYFKSSAGRRKFAGIIAAKGERADLK